MTFKSPRTILQISSLILVAFLAPFAAMAASTLTGVVTNGTTGKPSAGDPVVLLNLVAGMTEAGRTKTDAKGRFSLSVPDEGPHLIRVEHQKGAYFRQAPPGTQSVEINVYDVAEKVSGVSTEADVMKIETDNSGLKVTESFFIKNTSRPPRTQLSERSYEIFLPENVQIEASAAMSPGGMPVSSSPVPLGEKGHYAFAFPIRPNEPAAPNPETRFQLSYHVPYNGSFKFTPRLSLPTENVAVMIPKSMKFSGSAFQAISDPNSDPGTQTFLIKNVQPGQPIDFTVSGTGIMPREAQGADAQSNQAPGGDGPGPTVASPTTAANPGPGGGLGVPIDTPDPLTKYRWWILGGLSILLAVAAAFFLRKPTTAALPATDPALVPPAGSSVSTSAPPLTPSTQRNSMLAALKEELFALETERLEGKLTAEEYSNLKSAFEIVLRRTLAR